VLRIDTRAEISEGENPMQLVGDLPARKDKWQGAFIGQDGNMWAIPEGGYRILKVSPSAKRSGEEPTDVKVELM
jgi:predicted RNA-binding protein associated with RNAse of E/G family